MNRPARLLVAALAPALLGGCIASTAVSLATAPIRVASKAVDLATTSQSEADRNYGKKMRKKEAREGKAARQKAEDDAWRLCPNADHGGLGVAGREAVCHDQTITIPTAAAGRVEQQGLGDRSK